MTFETLGNGLDQNRVLGNRVGVFLVSDPGGERRSRARNHRRLLVRLKGSGAAILSRSGTGRTTNCTIAIEDG